MEHFGWLYTFRLIVWLVALAGVGLILGVLAAAWLHRLRRPRKPPPEPKRRTVKNTRPGRVAHAADMWRCDPADVTEAMEKAALRDLYAANYGASRATRRRWIADNAEVPPLPATSILMDRPHGS